MYQLFALYLIYIAVASGTGIVEIGNLALSRLKLK